MLEKNIEVRSIPITTDGESRTIKGTTIVFNSYSQKMRGWNSEIGEFDFVELIKPEAAPIEFLNEQDIVMLYNHSDDSVLARSKKGKGTLKYNVDEAGVNFDFEAKKTASGEEILQNVRSGDLDSCSFAFRIAENGDEWLNNGEYYIRTIKKFEMIRDFSIVINPAYEATSVEKNSIRSFDSFISEEIKIKEEREAAEKEEEIRIAEEQKIADELRKENELIEYYSKFNEVLERYKIN